MRSPKWPKIQAPTGRAAKPTKKVAKLSSVPAYALELGKNSFGNASAAMVPYRGPKRA
jgi:hypothetical protein